MASAEREGSDVEPDPDDRPPARNALRVVIADGQPLFARSLELVLGPTSDGRIEVVGTATTVGDALRVVAQTAPDLALVDLELAPPGGIDLVRRLTDQHHSVRVLALSSNDDAHVAIEALHAGAEAILTKAARPEQLLAPLLAVLQGWKVLSAAVLDTLVARAARPGAELLDKLDADQRRLWRMVADGLEISAIADELFVSERTAKRMVAELRERLGAGSRIEMAALAGRAGLLDAPSRP